MFRLLFKGTILILILVFISCRKERHYEKTSSGLEYYFLSRPDTGSFGKPGYYYLVELVGRKENDSVFVNSYTLGQRIKLVRSKPPLHSMLSDGLALLRIGDSVEFRMPADSFFLPLGQPVPAYLARKEKIVFNIRVMDILSAQAHLMKMYEFELDRMIEYLERKKWNYLTDSATGIKYEIIREGTGNTASEGDDVEISYLLTYLDGKIINRSKPEDNLTFRVGAPEFIQGLSRLAMLTREGSKIQAIIPFAEAFGESGNAYVDPYATVIIEMDLVKVNRKR